MSWRSVSAGIMGLGFGAVTYGLLTGAPWALVAGAVIVIVPVSVA